MKHFNGNVAAPTLVVLLCSLVLLVSGCMNSENSDLLNAPLAEESIRVRLLNLAGDAGARELRLENTRRTSLVPFGGLSTPVSSPADSAQATTLVNGAPEYSTPRRVQFSRNALFTLIALPAPGGTPAVDTILVLAASDSVEVRANNISYVSFINAHSDTSEHYSLRLGCPNGDPLATRIGFMGNGGKKELAAGTYTVSLLKQTSGNNADAVVGYYSVTIGAASDYSVILYRAQDNTPHLVLLHDRDTSSAALQSLQSVQESQAEVRVLNFSSQAVDISKTIPGQPDEAIAQGIASRSAGSFANVSACTSASEDTLKIGGTTHFVGVPLEVLKQYSVLTIDSGSAATANFSMVIPPLPRGTSVDSATIRVANLAWDFPALEISLGARTTARNNYVTGQILAPTLEFAEVSEPVRCEVGPAPFAVFSNGPKQLRTTAYVNSIQAGGAYLLVITRQGDNLQMALFDENNPTARPIEMLEEGTFVQVVNAAPDAATTTFSLGNIISNRAVYYGSASATVLPVGSHSFTAGGKSQTITTEAGKRTLVVIAGTAANPDIEVFTTAPMGALPTEIRRRFVNASTSVAGLTVALDYDGGSRYADNLPYLKMSGVDISKQARKITLVFMDASSSKTVLTRNNIPFSLGQNFTVVFAGTSAIGYRAILLQEF